jgi:DNA-binding MarR family transcriptional regulator
MVSRKQILQSVLENTAAIQRTMATSRDQFLRSMGVNRAQLEALLLLSKQPLSVKRLAELLRVTGGAATQMIDSLVAEGFVERLQNKTDGRSVDVQLTVAGKKKFATLRGAYLNRLGDILAAVSDEELNKLVQATDQVLSQIKSSVYHSKKDSE